MLSIPIPIADGCGGGGGSGKSSSSVVAFDVDDDTADAIPPNQFAKGFAAPGNKPPPDGAGAGAEVILAAAAGAGAAVILAAAVGAIALPPSFSSISSISYSSSSYFGSLAFSTYGPDNGSTVNTPPLPEFFAPPPDGGKHIEFVIFKF